MKVRTRIAPSPTGSPHVGTAYQALFDYAYAKGRGGSFIVRIEDTDTKRKVAGAEEELFEALEWLGLVPDESVKHGGKFGPYRQTDRLGLYKEYADKLVEKGAAYYCFCSEERLARLREKQRKKGLAPRYDGKCRNISPKEAVQKVKAGRKAVIRLKMPQSGKTYVEDTLRGRIEFDNKELDDQVLLKSNHIPTYHLAVVVDDHLMQITHPVRGEEWIPSYPKHKIIYQALGWKMPLYTHTPIIRGSKGEKLGKRLGHSSINWFRKEGFLPEALLNYLALLGWSHPKQKEFFTLDEFIESFDLKDLSPVGPVFDMQKLIWLNGEWIRFLPPEKLFARLEDYARYTGRVMPKMYAHELLSLARERMTKLSDFFTLCEFLDDPKYQANLKGNKPKIRLKTSQIDQVRAALGKLSSWQVKDIKQVLLDSFETLKGIKKRDCFVSLYILVEGKPVGLPLFDSMEILGKEKTLSRLKK